MAVILTLCYSLSVYMPKSLFPVNYHRVFLPFDATAVGSRDLLASNTDLKGKAFTLPNTKPMGNLQLTKVPFPPFFYLRVQQRAPQATTAKVKRDSRRDWRNSRLVSHGRKQFILLRMVLSPAKPLLGSLSMVINKSLLHYGEIPLSLLRHSKA